MNTLKPGEQNTDETLQIAFQFSESHGKPVVVVASTFGNTGLKAAQIGLEKQIPVIVVTHNAGFSISGTTELTIENRSQIEHLNAKILTGTMVLRGLGSAFKRKFGISDEDIVASVLRMFGQGMKVCVEMAAMVSDAGLIQTDKDIICVAGTGRGADTAVLINPASSNNFFDMAIKHIITKPNEF